VSVLRALGPAIALFCLSCAVGGASSPPIEPPVAITQAIVPAVQQTGWVTDAAGIIPDDAEQRLAARLAKLERRTGHQLVVITLSTLAGRDVADVADELGNAWHIGRGDHGHGVVILVAPNDRRVRISADNGMRRLLPDETCQRIIDETMAPSFRKNDLAGGIEAGADAIIAHLG
jgi:uncharacterized protein